MHSTLIIARIGSGAEREVARIFGEFDSTEMPHLMGTRRRELFVHHDLYFHLQHFDSADGGERIERARTDDRFIAVSADLKPYIEAYDPATWRSPADAMGRSFHRWDGGAPGPVHSVLDAYRMVPGAEDEVSALHEKVERAVPTGHTGVRRRELFAFHDLCVRIQHIDAQAAEAGAAAPTNDDAGIDALTPYRPADGRPAAGARARRFYHWSAK